MKTLRGQAIQTAVVKYVSGKAGAQGEALKAYETAIKAGLNIDAITKASERIQKALAITMQTLDAEYYAELTRIEGTKYEDENHWLP